MSEEKKLHPSVEEFKQFVKRHPKLVQEVRQKKRTWQELFEEWHLLGEDDAIWEKYKNTSGDLTKSKAKKSSNSSDFMGQIVNSLKKMDMNEVQRHITSVSGAISNIQQLLEQFQGSSNKNEPLARQRPQSQNQGPFSFNKD